MAVSPLFALLHVSVFIHLDVPVRKVTVGNPVPLFWINAYRIPVKMAGTARRHLSATSASVIIHIQGVGVK